MEDTPGRLRFDHSPVTTFEDRHAEGRRARKAMPRSAHSIYRADPDRDPLGIIRKQNETRLPWLVPLRLERMLENPFAFYRGTAALQAADLADTATTGASVVLCGDAHLSNFGMFASPQRTLVFDLNDFDEAAFGPWEWDVKRFVTSVVIAGRHKGLTAQEADGAALAAASAYRLALRDFLKLDALERYYRRGEVDIGAARYGNHMQKAIRRAIKDSKRRTSAHTLNKITQQASDGTTVIIEDPPTMTHLSAELEIEVENLVAQYRETVPPDISFLLSQYTVTDVVRRVVGVGSVGTRCFIVVLTGPAGEGLILQVKEARRSVLNEFGKVEPVSSRPQESQKYREDHGFRVVANQRILQSVSDPFLGYFTDGDHGFYVRQFRDRNVSLDINALKYQSLLDYVDACARMLARAHAQSPNAAFISGYLGKSDTFDKAVTQWANAYADQSHTDYEQLKAAIASDTCPLPVGTPTL